MDRRTMEYFAGCLVGGAVGDALGAPVEFLSTAQIRSEYGEQGLSDYDVAYGKKGAVTDDTQMALFTAEGLILSGIRDEYKVAGVVTAVYHAYLRWLYTQDSSFQDRLVRQFGTCSILDGILTGHKELFSQRAPGNSCLSALRSGKMGTMQIPINDSKGCGGVMRIAPIGLACNDADRAFRLGCECAAITHGHPYGFIASGAMAAMISMIISGYSLSEAVDESIKMMKTQPRHKGCVNAVELALDLSETASPSPETVEKIGAGWVAEEALAISIFCAMTAETDFQKGVLTAVNHSGDSDSTGAITGNIIGAMAGLESIPENWSAQVELKTLIMEIASDLYEQFARQNARL